MQTLDFRSLTHAGSFWRTCVLLAAPLHPARAQDGDNGGNGGADLTDELSFIFDDSDSGGDGTDTPVSIPVQSLSGEPLPPAAAKPGHAGKTIYDHNRQRDVPGPTVMLEPGFEGVTHAPTSPPIPYPGFRIEIDGHDHFPDVTATVAGIENQIDIVYAVGLPPGIMDFMRSLPIWVVYQPGFPGSFGGGREVDMGSIDPNDQRPILLHEYLHAYAWFKMPNGFNNSDVWFFYQTAWNGNLYPKDDYMMLDASEFFAVSGSCFLYGADARAPYSREQLQQTMPEWYNYLTTLFGTPTYQPPALPPDTHSH